MGITKTAAFTKAHNRIAVLLKAMAHPARVAIIDYLLQVDTCICGDIVNELPLAQATVSQHLKALKSAGLIKGTIEGNAICYCIDETSIADLRHYFAQIYSSLETKRKNCC